MAGFEQLLQKPHGHFVVGDNAVLQGLHRHHIAGGTPQHIAGSSAHLQDFSRISVQGNNTGLPDNQTLAVRVDQNIGGTQVNTQVIG